jgi:phage I-like protein
VKERSDGEILAGLIERSRLLLALSDDISVETKLETQPLLKQLEQLLAVPDGDQDIERIEATHALLSSALADCPDLDALLSAMRHFLPR